MHFLKPVFCVKICCFPEHFFVIFNKNEYNQVVKKEFSLVQIKNISYLNFRDNPSHHMLVCNNYTLIHTKYHAKSQLSHKIPRKITAKYAI